METEMTERSWTAEYTTATKGDDTESASTSASIFNVRPTPSKAKLYVAGALLFILAMSAAAMLLMEKQNAAVRKYDQATGTTETEEHVSWYRHARTTKMVPARRIATFSAADTTTSPEIRAPTAVTKLDVQPTSQGSGSSFEVEVETEDERNVTSRGPAPTTTVNDTSPAVATFETTDLEKLTTGTVTSSLQTEHPLVVCIVGGYLRSSKPPPDGICTYMVFEHVRVANGAEDFVAVSNQLALDNYMKMAAGASSPQFLLSLSADSEFDESLEVRERAVDIMQRYRGQNVHGYGFARYQVASAGIDTGKLWKHHEMLLNMRQWSPVPVVLFLGLLVHHHSSYPDAYVTGLVSEAAASMSFLILVTHHTAPPNVLPKRCQVELVSSWTRDAFNDRSLMSVEEAASVLNSSRLERDVHLPLLLSQSMAVVEYEVEKNSNLERPRLARLKCHNSSLLSFHTVCRSSSNFLSGGRIKPTFCHYDDDPVNGRWRTYKTAVDMVNEIQSVEFALDPSVAPTVGWAFYDLDLEDYRGDCASFWSSSGADSVKEESAAYYRLKHAVRQVMAFRTRRTSHPYPGSGSNST